MKEEKLQVLKMVEDGKITPEEGMELIDALEDREEVYRDRQAHAKWLKIRVYDPDEKAKVNVTIPLALMDVALKMAGKFGPAFVPELKEAGLDGEDLAELFEAIKNGAEGKLVDIQSENGESVEITVE